MLLIDKNMIPFKPITYTENGVTHYEMAVSMADVNKVPMIAAECVKSTKLVPVYEGCVMCLCCGSMLAESSSIAWNRCPMCGAMIER